MTALLHRASRIKSPGDQEIEKQGTGNRRTIGLVPIPTDVETKFKVSLSMHLEVHSLTSQYRPTPITSSITTSSSPCGTSSWRSTTWTAVNICRAYKIGTKSALMAFFVFKTSPSLIKYVLPHQIAFKNHTDCHSRFLTTLNRRARSVTSA